MVGEHVLSSAPYSDTARIRRRSAAFKKLETLLDYRPNCDAPDAARSYMKEAFSKFSLLKITDFEKKRQIIAELMRCTGSSAERRDLRRILAMETSPADYRMLLFAHDGTEVFFDYVCEKILSMKHLSSLSGKERDYVEDVLSAIVEMVTRDGGRFERAMRTLNEAAGEGASEEMRALIKEARHRLKLLDPSFAFNAHVDYKKCLMRWGLWQEAR